MGTEIALLLTISALAMLSIALVAMLFPASATLKPYYQTAIDFTPTVANFIHSKHDRT